VIRLRFVVALVFVAAVGTAALARPWKHGSRAADVVVAQSSLRPGGFAIVVRNESAATLRIAQVTVNDAFVPFRAARLVLTPHAQTRLTVAYGWLKGEPYEIGILTSTGAIVQSDVGGAEDA
jgi:zinc transporter, ZIP family